MLSDTTVAENNTKFSIDAKLAKKIIDRCNVIARKYNVKQRQTYLRTSKQLVRDLTTENILSEEKKTLKSDRKLKTIVGFADKVKIPSQKM